MKILNLYWENGRTGCLVVIKEDIDRETAKKIVEEYKNWDPIMYNTYDAIQFIKKHGYTIELVICYNSNTPVVFDTVDHEIPF